MDPLAEETMEPYIYVSNNPINLIDPNGLSPIPVSSVAFRIFAAKYGIKGNQQVGAFFERLAIASVRTTERAVRHNTSVNYPSPARSILTKGSPSAVRPDGIGQRVGYNTKTKQTLISESFYEAKATKATITKGYRSYQILGMIDALSNTIDQKRESPSLTLLTTSDTRISNSIIKYAGDRGVALYQSIATIDDETGEFSLSDRKWLNRDHERFGNGGAVDRIKNVFDWDDNDYYGKVNPSDYQKGNHSNGDPDPACLD